MNTRKLALDLILCFTKRAASQTTYRYEEFVCVKEVHNIHCSGASFVAQKYFTYSLQFFDNTQLNLKLRLQKMEYCSKQGISCFYIVS